MRMKIMKSKKGFVQAVLVIAIVGILLEGVIMTNFVQRTQTLLRAIRETDIILAVNNIELAKKSLQQALVYSTYQGYYDVANMAGYTSLNAVDSYECIPYLRIYDKTNFPADYEKNIQTGILNVFNKYAKDIKYSYLTIPDYTYVKIDKNQINVSSGSDLKHTAGYFEIKNNPAISADFPFEIKRMFEFAKQNFVDDDRLGGAVSSASDASDAVVKMLYLESAMQSELGSASYGKYDISFTPYKISSGDSSFALRVLVKIVDKSSDAGYPIYDATENVTKERNIEMKFYVLTGKGEHITAETSQCKNAALIPQSTTTTKNSNNYGSTAGIY
jgi:hypothetical protein